LDYQKIIDEIPGAVDYNISPRNQWAFSIYVSPEGAELENDGSYCAVATIDTDREKAIDLGPSYPFAKQGSGECIVPESFKTDEN
jgi:hypothetical protein